MANISLAWARRDAGALRFQIDHPVLDADIEGTIDPAEHEPEGPFGEYTGVMSGRSSNNVLRVDSISHREQPQFLSIVPGQSQQTILSALGAWRYIKLAIVDDDVDVRDISDVDRLTIDDDARAVADEILEEYGY